MTIELIFNLIAVAVLVILGLLVLGAVRMYRKTNAENAATVESWGDEPAEAALVEKRGVITEKHCSAEVKGTKNVALCKEFYLIFESEDGNRMRIDVDEETYIETTENQKGTAAFVGDRFYGFCHDVED